MSKHILPHELAEIVTALLIDPVGCGELDAPCQYNEFFLAIADVVADHCGGVPHWVNPPIPASEESDSDEAGDAEDALPSLSVSPSESLPSLRQNIWAAYAPDGWEDTEAESCGIDIGEPLTHDAARNRRVAVLTQLIEAAGLGRQVTVLNDNLSQGQWIRTEAALPPTRTHAFVKTDFFPEGIGILWRDGKGFIHLVGAAGSLECIRRGGVAWVRRHIHEWMVP